MTRKISNREWEALSAFLDDQLSSREYARLKSRLDDDEDLRIALEELRETRSLLKSQPIYRAPRNFTLSPEMAGMSIRKRQSMLSFSTFRFATVLATVFLVIVFIGDIFVSDVPGSGLFEPQTALEVLEEEAVALEGAPEITEIEEGSKGGELQPAEAQPEMAAPLFLEKEEHPAEELPAMADSAPQATQDLRTPTSRKIESFALPTDSQEEQLPQVVDLNDTSVDQESIEYVEQPAYFKIVQLLYLLEPSFRIIEIVLLFFIVISGFTAYLLWKSK